MITERIDQDLKQAMLNGQKDKVATLRGLKSAIQYAAVASSGSELNEAEIISVLQKEVKKLQEAADLYAKGADSQRAGKELAEKKIIEQYLPAQMSEAELNQLIDQIIGEQGPLEQKNMGQIIGQVKTKTAGSADGATIARLVGAKLK